MASDTEAPTKTFTVTVKAFDDPSYEHEVDVTDHVGSSSYERCLDGLYRKVDLERFYVDSTEADAEHERRRS